MDTLEYTMIIEPAEDGEGEYYCAYFPDLPGCTTMGATLDQLRENGIEAVSGHIKASRSLGKPIPPPSVRATTIHVQAS